MQQQDPEKGEEVRYAMDNIVKEDIAEALKQAQACHNELLVGRDTETSKPSTANTFRGRNAGNLGQDMKLLENVQKQQTHIRGKVKHKAKGKAKVKSNKSNAKTKNQKK